MNTPTPRTDEFEALRDAMSTRASADYVSALQLCDELERELTAVTEQRDQFESKLCIALRGHPDSELWGDAGLIASTMRCVDALDEVIEQRDQWKEKYIQQNKDLGHELRDPNGTIWSECKRLQTQLTAVTEQRDRLADLVKQFIYIIDITEESASGRLFHPTNITSCRAGDLQKIGGLVEALRRASRTTNPNEL
jgi:hypothetical protein